MIHWTRGQLRKMCWALVLPSQSNLLIWISLSSITAYHYFKNGALFKKVTRLQNKAFTFEFLAKDTKVLSAAYVSGSLQHLWRWLWLINFVSRPINSSLFECNYAFNKEKLQYFLRWLCHRFSSFYLFLVLSHPFVALKTRWVDTRTHNIYVLYEWTNNLILGLLKTPLQYKYHMGNGCWGLMYVNLLKCIFVE